MGRARAVVFATSSRGLASRQRYFGWGGGEDQPIVLNFFILLVYIKCKGLLAPIKKQPRYELTEEEEGFNDLHGW